MKIKPIPAMNKKTEQMKNTENVMKPQHSLKKKYKWQKETNYKYFLILLPCNDDFFDTSFVHIH